MTPHDTRWQTRGPWWVLVAAVGVLATAAWSLIAAAGPASEQAEDPAMLQVAPGGRVALASLPAEHQTLYRAAAADPEAFEAVACYCGCEAFLDHRHLRDCFVRPDDGWERHATGCTICLVQARAVVELRVERVPLDEIVERIDARYGVVISPPSG